MPKDATTRFQGVYARHKKNCAIERGSRCSCTPSYWGKAWDRGGGRYLKTPMLSTPSAASHARSDLLEELKRGKTPIMATIRVAKAIDSFLEAAQDGVALNKHGRRYKPSAVRDLDGCLTQRVAPALGSKRLGDVRRGDCQHLVDELTPVLSGSRVRSVVNAIRSLYRWAQDRDLVQHDPAALVRLPAMDATPRDRVATPEEMVALLAALPIHDALPYAIAAYTTGRRAEIRHALVEDVDLDLEVLYLGADENGRKSRAAQRAVPLVKPLAVLVRRSLMARGRPDGGELLCPGHKPGGRNSGKLSFEGLQTRADEAWLAAKLNRITAHECRHTCITWLDAAGVRPKVVSVLAGHAVPRAQRDAAAITQQRYTHTLPGDLTRARDLFSAYLAEATRDTDAASSVPTAVH
jgi:integrase